MKTYKYSKTEQVIIMTIICVLLIVGHVMWERHIEKTAIESKMLMDKVN